MTSGQVGSPETSKTNASGKMNTPSSNNYAAPHTPIASAKRPRHPGSRSSLNQSNSGSQLNGISERGRAETSINATSTPVRRLKIAEDGEAVSGGGRSDQRGRSLAGESQMSPMHPPKPVIDHSRDPISVGAPEGILDDGVDQEGGAGAESSNGSWVGIFSPVLNFLKSNEDSPDEKIDEPSSKPFDAHVENGVDGDGDVTMADHAESATDHEDQPTYTHQPQTGVEPSSSLDDSIDDNSCGDEQHHDDEDLDEEEFNPYLFIKSLPEYASVVPHPQSKICLPPKDPSDPPITLVLDLDETLVHCTVEPISDADMIFPVTFNGIQYKVHVRTRPYLMEFLEAVSKKFEVVVFTASQRVYANELLKRIDPDGKYIKHRIFREACLLVEGNYLKDLNVLNRNLSASVLVDNSPHAFGYQVDNGIPIESWFDDPDDSELLKLERFLETLHGVNDVKTIVRSKFQTYKLIRDA